MTLGSLFDGIGGFPLSGLGFGIEPVWASEIEPFPIRVTQIRFPNMQHVGDITKLNGAELEPVDIITGGSPCQDLSVAGKRAGLQGERSGLFMEQVRVIKEARAKFGKPRFMVWENVPGAFSSAGGEDFRAVIEETARIAEAGVSIPRPADGKWAGAGCIMGDTWSIAWRVLDAQFWGVPQRRRRIFLVADFGGQSAPEILFKHESLSGNTAEGAAQGEGIAEGIEGGAGTAIAFEPGAIARDMGIRNWEEVAPTLAAKAGDNQPAVYCLQGNGIDRADTAGCNGKGWTEDVSYTLNTLDRPAVVKTLQMREDKAGGGKGPLIQTDQSATLGTGNTQVAFTPSSFGNYQEGCGSLRANGWDLGGGSETLVSGTYSFQRSDELKTSDISHTLSKRDYKDATDLVASPLSVRRLTPLECERLQGFPDGWTDIPKATDSARYKALGNSVAIPCVKFVLQGIAEELRRAGE